MNGLDDLQAAFRAAAAAIDPDGGTPPDPATASPSLVRAWLVVQSVRIQPRWLVAAEAAVQRIAAGERVVPDSEVAAWVEACCAGWVLRASGPFRPAAELLGERLTHAASDAVALLALWRITGRLELRDRALASLGDASSPEALHAGWLATADEALRERAAGMVRGSIAPSWWGLASDHTGITAEDVDLAELDALTDPERVIATAPLATTPLHLEVAWFVTEELAEGPMAEAATWPWPGLRIRFSKLPYRDQIQFRLRLGDGPVQHLEDVGVVAAWLEDVCRSADRGPLLDAAPRRTARKGGLRRR